MCWCGLWAWAVQAPRPDVQTPAPSRDLSRGRRKGYGSSLCFPGCLYLYSVLCAWGKPADTFIHPTERLPGGEELKEVSILAQRKWPVAPQLCSHVLCACLLSASGHLGRGRGAGSRNHAVCAQLEPKCLCPGVRAWEIIWVCTHMTTAQRTHARNRNCLCLWKIGDGLGDSERATQ